MVFVLYILVNITISSEWVLRGEFKTHSISQFCDYPFENTFYINK